MKRIYLDYAASTPIDPRVVEAMRPYWNEVFANPFSAHQEGRAARRAVEEARERVADLFEVAAGQIVFTSGATEANSLAIQGYCNRLMREERQEESVSIAVSAIEHMSVLDVAQTMKLEEKGITVHTLPVASDGLVDERSAATLFKEQPALVSIGHANSEIGVIQPIQKLARHLRKNNPTGVFHVDASQAPLWLDVTAILPAVDLLTLDSQKVYGPKGVGLLFVRDATQLDSLFGGAKDLRPGTPNVPGIVGFVKALAIAHEERESTVKRVEELRDYCIEQIEKKLPFALLNGSRGARLANNINFSFPGHEGEFLVAQLDAQGIACSTRSACLSVGQEGSYVVAALEPHNTDRAQSSLRFSLGRETAREHIDTLITLLTTIVG